MWVSQEVLMLTGGKLQILQISHNLVAAPVAERHI